jgi:hypothetical protein
VQRRPKLPYDTLQALGPQGWSALEAQCRADAEDAKNEDRRS